MHLKLWSGKWRPFCFGIAELSVIDCFELKWALESCFPQSTKIIDWSTEPEWIQLDLFALLELMVYRLLEKQNKSQPLQFQLHSLTTHDKKCIIPVLQS